MLTQPQHQPITELSSVAYNCFSLLCFILSLPGEESCSPHADRAEKYEITQRHGGNHTAEQRQLRAADLWPAWYQLLITGEKGSREATAL